MSEEESESWSPRTQIVLVVDDEEDILESIKDLIEATLDNVEVIAVPSARQGLERLEGDSVDLVVSDYKMPDMDGLEFLQECYRLRPQTPRIMITAFPDLEVAIGAINDARIENFFTKPLDPDRVVEVIEQALQGQQTKVQRDQAFSRSLDTLRKRKESS